MSFTKTDIHQRALRDVKAQAGMVRDIDAEIRTIAKDISGRDDFLIDQNSTFLSVSGTRTYNLDPTTRSLFTVYIDGESPMSLVHFNETHGTATGKPNGYWTDGLTIRLTPTPNAAYTISYLRSKYHGETITTLEFKDQFADAVVFGVIKQLHIGQLARLAGAAQTAANYSALYEAEVEKRRMDSHDDVSFVRYRDI